MPSTRRRRPLTRWRRSLLFVALLHLVVVVLVVEAGSSPAIDHQPTLLNNHRKIVFRHRRLALTTQVDEPAVQQQQQQQVTAFIPVCGDSDDEYDDEPETIINQQQQQKQQPAVEPAVWLGYSSKLYGGFFNLTISGQSVRPFGRCVAASSKFNLIEHTGNDPMMTAGGHDDKCYRCLFVDRRSSHVVQMRTSALQCLTTTGNNPAGSDTLYRICASVSPSLPLLTMLRTDGPTSVTNPFEVGNYRVSYEYSSASSGSLDVSALVRGRCGPDDGAGRSRACVDASGIHLYLANSPGCEPLSGQLRGVFGVQFITTWSQQQSESDHHMFAFVRLQLGEGANNSPSSIRCALYRNFNAAHNDGVKLNLAPSFERRHHGFAVAIANSFDCSELNGVVLKHPHQHHKQPAATSVAHIFHLSSVTPPAPGPVSVPTTVSQSTQSSTSLSTPTPPIIDAKKSREMFASSQCSLPSFVLSSKNWHSVDVSSFQLVATTSSTFTLSINLDGNEEKLVLYLTCIEPEIWDRSSPDSNSPGSRIYQAVYGVLLNPAGVSFSKRSAENETKKLVAPVRKEFTCSMMAPPVAEGTAKRSQRQQPSLNASSTTTQSTTTAKQRPRKQQQQQQQQQTFRCVKFYQRDRNVIEMVIGSATHGPSAVVCADFIKEEHRALLVSDGVFMGYSSNECLSIPLLPGLFAGGLNNNNQQGLGQQSLAGKSAPIDDILNRACLVRLCAAISATTNVEERSQWEVPTYLVFRKGSTCSSDADPDLSLFFAVQRCAYRWRRDYVTDNLLFSPIIKPDSQTLSSLSCFILRHNGVSSAVSRLIPNPNCWLDSQGVTVNGSTSKESSSFDRDEFYGFIFNAHEACHLPTQEPKFVNGNSKELLRFAGAVASRDTSRSSSGEDQQSPSSPDDFYEASSTLWRRLTSSAKSGSSTNKYSPPLAALTLATAVFSSSSLFFLNWRRL